MTGKMLFAVCALGLLAALGCATPRTDIITAEEVRKGMKGYGKTVFEGTRIDKFDVEVIDVLWNYMPKKHIVLVKCGGPVVEKTGIVGGMSGSPIYLYRDENDKEGRLLGALAYGWSWQRGAIAGITPIQYMLAEMERPLEKTSMAPDSSRDVRLAASRRDTGPDDFADIRLRPCESPLMISGLSPRALAYAQEVFRDYSLVPMQGAGGGPLSEMNVKVEPGSALGIDLISGDIGVSAIGTVTYCEGDRVLAFGHSFLNGGEQSLPVVSAYVQMCLPLVSRSFKMASPVKTVGRLVQDRESAVFCRLGEPPSMIPVRITVRNAKTGHSEEMNCKVARHDLLTVQLVNMCMMRAVEAFEESSGDNISVTTATFEFEGYEPVTVKSTAFGRGGTYDGSPVSQFASIFNNPYEKLSVKSFTAEVSVLHQRDTAVIKAFYPDKNEAHPGEEINCVVVLQPFGKDDVRVNVRFRVPEDVPDGTDLVVRVQSGNDVSPDLPRPNNVREIIEWVKLLKDANDLVCTVSLPSRNLRYRGKTLPRLPDSFLGPMAASFTEQADIEPETIRICQTVQWTLEESATAHIRVTHLNK